MLPKLFVAPWSFLRVSSYGGARVAAVASLVGGVVVAVLAPRAISSSASQPSGTLAVVAAASGDTQVVFGPRVFSTPNGNTTTYVERFAVAVQPARRYTLRLVNGAADGTKKATGGTLILNGRTLFGGPDFASGATLTRVVEVFAEDTIQVTVAPYFLHLVNGNRDGTSRMATGSLTLNGVLVATGGDINQGVAGVVIPVTLQAQNTFQLGARANPSGFLDVRFTATDTTRPTITITSPAPGLITRDTLVTVAGSVQDQTATSVAVNGQAASMTGNAFSLSARLAAEGQNTLHIVATDAAGHSTDSVRTVIRDTQQPVLTVNSPANNAVTKQTSITVSGSVTDQTAVTVNANGVPLPVDGAGQFTGQVPLAEGQNFVTVTATDAAGNAATVVRSVTRDTQAPVLTVSAPADGAVIDADHVTVAGSVTDATAVTVTANGASLPVAPDHSFSGDVALTEGANTIAVVATDAATNSTTVTRSVTRQTSNLPPDPATVATPIDPTVATTVAASTAFLYSGSNPVQTGVAPGTISPIRASVLRGKVLTRDGQPLPGVTVTILGHPEFGETLSRADGRYDLAVNGGGALTVSFEKAGFLAAQRPGDAPWQDYAAVDDVVLIGADPQVTAIDFTQPMEVARGAPQTDASGTRQATLLFPQGTQATLVMPDGSTQDVGTLHVRATEYTVGPSGPKAMPAPLPPASAYTYAVELGADEAVAARATRVELSQPAVLYLENFLGFPVGMAVPLGSYDRDRAVWVPAQDGRVVKVLDTSGGTAALDTDGDGVADDPAALAALGITDAERARLAELYQPGQSLWRAPISHFSPWDCNAPRTLPPGAKAPNPKAARGGGGDKDNPCPQTGNSVIECENQVLGERIGVVGMPFTLNYRSSRVPGRSAAKRLVIPLIGDTVPPGLVRIALEIRMAGRVFEDTFPATPNQQTVFDWDGKDAYGRVVQGLQPVSMFIGYMYGGVYRQPAPGGQSFGQPGAEPVTGVVTRVENTLALWQRTTLGAWDARAEGLGGWTLDVHHAYDPVGRTLYLGDGTQRSTGSLGQTIRTVAGTGIRGFRGDNGPATEAELLFPSQVTAAPDGSFYIADIGNERVRRVSSLGIITTVAGTGAHGFDGDGGPAVDAQLSSPADVAVGPDGSLYIADALNNRIRRVGPEGIITTFAGTGDGGWSGDGAPATAAQIDVPEGVAVGPDGSVYIAEGARVRRVGPDGIITTVAGDSVQGSSGDGGLATAAELSEPTDVAVGSDGAVYITDLSADRVRRVGPDGIITTVAGTGEVGFSGDGGPATTAQLYFPQAIAVGSDRSLYIADVINSRVRRVAPDGIITTVAGTGDFAFGGDGGPPAVAPLNGATGVALGPDGTLYIADQSNQRIRAIGPTLPGLGTGDVHIASADGAEVYVFDAAGRQLRTADALTGTTRYAFGYDAAGRLATVTDRDSNVSTVDRSGDGTPTAIVGPFGQRTTLTLDANGYLASATNPAGETTQLMSSADGLMLTRTDPTLSSAQFTYDSLGRLIRDADGAGGFTQLTRTDSDSGSTVSLTTALGATTTYATTTDPAGGERRRFTMASGLVAATSSQVDGRQSKTRPDGTMLSLQLGPDPRFGMQSPIARSLTTTLPGGRTATLRVSRSPSDSANPMARTDTIEFNGQAFVSTYDRETRSFANRTAEGRTAIAVGDTLGRMVSLEVPGITSVSWVYDARGRLSETHYGDRVWQFAYNANGFSSGVTDPLGRVTTFATDVAGRLQRIMRPDTTQIAYVTDSVGNITTITAPGGAVHRFSYTPVGQTARYVGPGDVSGSRTTTYTYNTARQLTAIGRPDGSTVTLGYDAGGRRTSFTTAQGSYGVVYDSATGMINKMTAPSGSVLRYTYDGYLVTGVSLEGPVQGTIELEHDANFRVSALGVNHGDLISLGYDRDGILTQVGELVLSRRQDNGQLTQATVQGVTTAWAYNDHGEYAQRDDRFNGTTLLSRVYTRDALGRLSEETETVQGDAHVLTYSYDRAGRLSGVTRDGSPMVSLEYDANGNRIRVTRPTGVIGATYDSADRLLTLGAETFTYGAAGELLTRSVGGETTQYRYDGVGNLIGATLSNGTAIDYLLDPKGRRIGKKVNGTLVQSFMYQSQLNPIVEFDGSGQILSRFVYGTNVNVPDYMVRSRVLYRLITDELGSVRLVVNATTGDVVQRIDYDESGSVTLNTNPGFQPFGFAGGLYDDDSKLVHFNAREYDPRLGRWMTVDPVGFAGGTNLYEYANGDPVNRADPSGLCDTVNDGFAPNGAAILRAAQNSGEWVYSQGSQSPLASLLSDLGLNLPFFQTDPPRNTADYKNGDVHIGDCTDFVYWATKEGMPPSWGNEHQYSTKLWTGAFKTFNDQELASHGWQRIERDAARAGDIVVSGGHAGVYVCTDDKCDVWGLADNGSPWSSDAGYRDSVTGLADFSRLGTPIFRRPIAP